MKIGYVYMMASYKRGTIYTGMTSDLVSRVWQHKTEANDGFTKKHSVKRLVWFEDFERMIDAIAYEKRLKKYKRIWKIELIERANPEWREMHPESGLFI